MRRLLLGAAAVTAITAGGVLVIVSAATGNASQQALQGSRSVGLGGGIDSNGFLRGPYFTATAGMGTGNMMGTGTGNMMGTGTGNMVGTRY
jgi:hypothetical protein